MFIRIRKFIVLVHKTLKTPLIYFLRFTILNPYAITRNYLELYIRFRKIDQFKIT